MTTIQPCEACEALFADAMPTTAHTCDINKPAIKPCEMTRELRLKLALARLLPDDIEVTDLCNFKWRRGRYAGKVLRDTEWNYVVEIIDAKLSENPQNDWFLLGEIVMSIHDIKWEKPC